ncbi:hypothetical protein BC332_34199 [Capsicum chinense]|nr:hypothetical protein BC332_34199 [Capsicum chinense]
MVPWCHGATVPRRHGATAPLCVGATVPWRHAATAPWCRGAMVPRRRAAVPWCRGAMVPWCDGALVPRCLGAAVPWCLGATVPRCDGAMVPWCVGATVPWCRGAMVPRRRAAVPWCHGAAVRWCHGALVPRCDGAAVPRCDGAMVPRCRGAAVPPWQATICPSAFVIGGVSSIALDGHKNLWLRHASTHRRCSRRVAEHLWRTPHRGEPPVAMPRIPLVRTSSELVVRRAGKAPEGTVPSSSPGRYAATRSRRGSSSSSPPTADGFGTGTPVPSPQSQSFSRSYGSILPTSLAYIVPSTRGCSPWRPNAVMSTTGCGWHSVLRIFKGRWERTGYHATCGALLAAGPYLLLNRFQGVQAVKQKR